MAQTLTHRGPDDFGLWIDSESRVALGHTRLSVIDTSSAGRQPLSSPSGRYVISYNGEVYNYLELKCELDSFGYSWRSESDTEVLVTSIEHWGVERALQRLIGMFAFAVWDQKLQALHLVRDRFGQKPLYYGYASGHFIFASELKSIFRYKGFNPRLNLSAFQLFLRYGYIPTPYSIFEDIRKLPPASYLKLSRQDLFKKMYCEPKVYWDLKRIAIEGIHNPIPCGFEEASHQLEDIIGQAVRRRLVSDVPIGAFLSSGIDSSLIVALMQSQSEKPVRTFSIGVRERNYNEAPQAKEIANHLNTDHTELYVEPKDLVEAIPEMAHVYDEPFADSSQIPTFILSKLTRQYVTVALSGDGGDEMFAGYNRHYWGRNLWRLLSGCPMPVRRAVSNNIQYMAQKQWERLFNLLYRFLPGRFQLRLPGNKLQKAALVMRTPDRNAFYLALTSLNQSPWLLMDRHVLTPDAVCTTHLDAFSDLTHFIQYQDMRHYLVDDIMTKVDRASMAVGLEARSPFIDHTVAEFSWKIPLSMKVDHLNGKRILKHILMRHLPTALFKRPKSGFGIPVSEWLRVRLRDWSESLLNVRALQRSGLFNVSSIRKMWREHLSGRHDWGYQLWIILMFQLWYDEWFLNSRR